MQHAAAMQVKRRTLQSIAIYAHSSTMKPTSNQAQRYRHVLAHVWFLVYRQLQVWQCSTPEDRHQGSEQQAYQIFVWLTMRAIQDWRLAMVRVRLIKCAG